MACLLTKLLQLGILDLEYFKSALLKTMLDICFRLTDLTDSLSEGVS